MPKYEDPLTLDEIEVNDISTAMYTLKISNDLYFAVNHMSVTMEKEYSRNVSENFQLEYNLVKPYLETDTTITSEGYSVTIPLTEIPKPLPECVPENIRAAVVWLDKQLAINHQRFEVELAEDVAPLNESRRLLESKVKAWFKLEVESNATWLNGSRKCTLSGSTLTYSAGNVSFTYNEMEFD